MAQQQLQPVSLRLECFLKYVNFKPVNEDELNLAVNFISSNLGENSVRDYGYWYNMYSYCSKNFAVLRHKKKNNVSLLVTKLGECVCQEKVINFLKNTDKKCLCNKECSSVYYNVVF